ncbi:hypothetical protein MF406_06315 [Georgenia sp. TF02-10]|uniref:hypothetical protein n=1 Tax=Georgenia sp. TF02-10 TaxID=2917725 RepID=UPI001FA6E78A|nr:hypothetical protein [Georgenia sp. TF02-10]UNX55844.1 hypothetical protein MF406_06315 [Georgenia sp. TF02-10]
MAGRQRLSAAERTLVVLAVLAILGFAVVLGLRLATAPETRPPADAATAPTTIAGTADPSEPAGEDLSGVAFDFVTPSGNIACTIEAERALCGIADFDYDVPPAEAEACPGTLGHFLQVDADGAALVCDTSGQELGIDADGVPVLDYGQERTTGAYTCTSSEEGVTCAHDPSGHSFTVRRAAYGLS